jgi:hypothetical protein
VNAGSRYVSTVSTECNVSNAGAESSAPRLYCDFSKLFGGQTVLPMPKAIELITTRIMEQAKKDQQLRPPYDDLSDNIWSPPLRMQDGQSAPVVGYIARPHAAVWATPPFLHNGSVPTLYDLLSPSFLPEDRLAPPAEWPAQWRDSWKREREYEAAIRPKCFLVGDLEYDPVKVGYQVHPCDPRSRPDNQYSGFNFETSRPGNSNEGHEFSDYDRRTLRKFSEEECRRLAKHSRDGILGCGLAHEERLALIEYLKTCDLDDLFDWQPGGTQKKWDPAAPPVTLCRRPLTVVRQ